MDLRRHIYVSPQSKAPLECRPSRMEGEVVAEGELVDPSGVAYPIRDGIPDLTFPRELAPADKEARAYYDDAAAVYDDVANLTFRIQYVDERKARESFVAALELRPQFRVLELACGTGRDSEIIAERLGPAGSFYLQDLSRAMLTRCRERLRAISTPAEFSTANASFLPFADHTFDAVFSFGGLGVFGDAGQALREIVRVAKVGAKVVVGDESMPPWLRDTEYGRILLHNNRLFEKAVPLEDVPVEARDVVLRWVIGGVYYLLEFRVGEGEPRADFDLEIPGRRGGTLRTRYQGRLEGVSPEAKELAERARAKTGKSMFQWLDEVVRAAAENDLGSPPRKRR
jgi:ubiquinone/menaquinone biosynthesis C-methylase UbiE